MSTSARRRLMRDFKVRLLHTRSRFSLHPSLYFKVDLAMYSYLTPLYN